MIKSAPNVALSHQPASRTIDLGPLVKRSYNRLEYHSKRNSDPADSLINKVIDEVETGSPVLDIGCGSGVPVTKMLSQHFHVTGIDISSKQASLAKENVPDATVKNENILHANLPANSFDAVVMYYTLFNIYRQKHSRLLDRIYDSLKQGGILLFDSGRGNCRLKIQNNWLGSEVAMYWSYHPNDKYMEILKRIGYGIEGVYWKAHKLDGDKKRIHPFILAKK